ncbi:MAG: hypothetical protein ACQEWI_07295 [Bacillota bacterium]
MFRDEIGLCLSIHVVVCILSSQLEFKENPDRGHHFYTVTSLEHSHGAGATNLGLAVDRNIQIINDIVGEEVYEVQRNTIFSQFTTDK